MNNKKKNEGRTDFSYYGLYLLDYLTTNKFEQAADEAFIIISKIAYLCEWIEIALTKNIFRKERSVMFIL